MRLTLVTPPAEEPVSLVEAKLYLRIDIDEEDALVSSLVTAARVYCENYLRQALVTQTWRLDLDSFPSAGGYYNRAIREIWPSMGSLPSGLGFYPGMVPNSTGVIDIPRPPLQSITSVQYYDFQGVLQTVAPASYNVSIGTPARIQPAYSQVWPVSRPTIDSVQVTFVAGYGNAAAIPAPIVTAIKIMTTHWYENRDTTVTGTLVASVPGAVDALLASCDHGSYA
ncbi:phage conserved hypothetical protein, phiE125 gp8 family [Singulisphaera sp. GP187]|uniref:head-tail connector protein n=1 Tax=Singulisphaera sp. GP187 TaxID=1882752 RepID=UPI000927D3A3|nr:head-tail connector protein [Singulisphaera sp. GP187]SIO60154.1 phage conserved hypothetical protein, phiE125 gp8 family [Singulisphaera sp. GP187]